MHQSKYYTVSEKLWERTHIYMPLSPQHKNSHSWSAFNLSILPCSPKSSRKSTWEEASMWKRYSWIKLDNVISVNNHVLGPCRASKSVIQPLASNRHPWSIIRHIRPLEGTGYLRHKLVFPDKQFSHSSHSHSDVGITRSPSFRSVTSSPTLSTTLQLHILISNDSNTLFIHTTAWSEIMFLKYNFKNECVSSVQ